MEVKSCPLVTIIITTYNRPNIIEGAIQNVLNQTYPNKEIIVIDDNGKNSIIHKETEKKVKKYDDKKIRYFVYERNQGSNIARNNGAEMSTGNFIAFFDDDDEWREDKISLQMGEFLKTDQELGFVYCYQSAVDIKTKHELFSTKFSFGEGYIYDRLLFFSKGTLATPNPLIFKPAFLEVGGFDPKQTSAQDFDLFLRISKLYQVKCVPEILHFAIIHRDKRISINHKAKLNGYTRLLLKYQKDMTNETIAYVNKRIIFHCFWLNDFDTAHQSYLSLLKHKALTFKYFIMYKGISNPIMKIMIKTYFKYVTSLVK